MVDFGVLSGNVSVANFGNKENVVSVATEGITMSRVAADALPVLLGNAVSWVFICVTLTALLFPTQRNSSMKPR